jgi:hypothetical protein
VRGTETFAYSSFGLGVTVHAPSPLQVVDDTLVTARAVRRSVAR